MGEIHPPKNRKGKEKRNDLCVAPLGGPERKRSLCCPFGKSRFAKTSGRLHGCLFDICVRFCVFCNLIFKENQVCIKLSISKGFEMGKKISEGKI